MKEILSGVFDGLILLAIGSFACFLILSGRYSYYINPRFEWLTGLTAISFIVTGIITIFEQERSISLSRMATYTIFIAVITIGAFSEIPRATQAQRDSTVETVSEEGSRVSLDGVEYIKINLAELLSISEDHPGDMLGMRYVVRGMVRRSNHSDNPGYFVIVRTFMWCCQADSVAVGFPSFITGFHSSASATAFLNSLVASHPIANSILPKRLFSPFSQ